MFKGIVAEHGRCGHCDKPRWVASIPELARDGPYQDEPEGAVIRLCAGCIYGLVRLAQLLLKLEAAPKKKAPQRPAKARVRRGPKVPIGPQDHDEPAPAMENRARMPQERRSGRGLPPVEEVEPFDRPL